MKGNANRLNKLDTVAAICSLTEEAGLLFAGFIGQQNAVGKLPNLSRSFYDLSKILSHTV